LGPNLAGVLGTSDTLPGVVGTSDRHYGVYGFSTNAAGVLGEAGPAAYAGVFNGKVAVNGLFSAASVTANVKAAVVPFPDGSKRVLYCMESPDHWFEDFGTAKLKRGRATVKLDADFAKVIKRADYRVFVTPEGDCGGLYVHGKSAASFEVRELMGGKSNVAFSYRIVGRRKDIKERRRYALATSCSRRTPWTQGAADSGRAARVLRPCGEGCAGAQAEARGGGAACVRCPCGERGAGEASYRPQAAAPETGEKIKYPNKSPTCQEPISSTTA